LSSISPKIGQAAVASIHNRFPNAKVIGIKTNRVWQGEDKISVNGTVFRVVLSNSVLQIRELFLTAEEDLPIVILTNLDESELGNDLLARFPKRRLWSLPLWPLIAEFFQAKLVAPSLQNKKWLAEALLERLSPQNFPPIASGMVDEDTVWRIVLQLYLDIDQSRPDAKDLLEWTLKKDSIDRLPLLNVDLKEGIYDWLKQSSGLVGTQILNTIALGYGKDAISLGLTMLVVFGQTNNQTLMEASIRLERFVGNKLNKDACIQWGSFAGNLLRKLYKNDDSKEQSRIKQIIQKSDEILQEIGALDFAYLSDYSPKGFEMRLEQYAYSLQTLLKSPFNNLPEKILEQHKAIANHWQAQWLDEKDRVLKVTMSLRLANWLANISETEDFTGFSEIAEKYVSEISFVDLARQTLYPGDKQESLSKTFNLLLKIVIEKRETFNHQFAKLLTNWTEFGSSTTKLINIEDVLKQVVAKVAHSSNALLIVLDGMSYAVFYELLEDIFANGWGLLSPNTENKQESSNSNWPKPILSTLPSITESSRTSLLCGQLIAGTSVDEIKGFKTNPDLVKVSKANNLPILFHKNTLTENGKELLEDVRKEIGKKDRKVVGVVFNAIDDNLFKGEQLAVKWTLSFLPALAQLLETARDAGRVVILTSDHGHILERDTNYRKASQGERYRLDDNAIMPDEIKITGSRVLTVTNNTLIFPWSESIRYSRKKYGYHGGVTPQEMLVPLAVMTWNNKNIAAWNPFIMEKPVWWTLPERTTESSYSNETIKKKKSKNLQQDEDLPLFDMVEKQ